MTNFHFYSNITLCYSFILYLFFAGQFISTLEMIFINKEFKDTGAFSWKILRFERQQYMPSSVTNRFLSLFFTFRGVVVILLLRLLCLIGMVLFSIDGVAFTVFAFIVLISLIAIHFRNVYGGDGSDQMSTILSFCLFAGCGVFMQNSILERASIWFIAVQSCLSYCSAGIAKMASSKWRSGEATYEIFNTASHGSFAAAKVLSNNKRLSFILSWMAILFESLFPFCLLMPLPVVFAFLLCGITFHLVNAVVMGLNSFFWIFIATYPAILYTWFSLHQ